MRLDRKILLNQIKADVMNKFKFRLPRIKNNKSERVRQKTHILDQLHSRQENIREEVLNLKSELDTAQKTNLFRAVEGCLVKDLVYSQKQIKKLINAIKVLNAEQEVIDGQIEKLHVCMLKLDNEKNILEKLREKRHLQYFQEQNNEEQKLLADSFLITKKIKKII